MGPLLLTGLTILGALIALGMIAAANVAPAAGAGLSPARRLALIIVAFASGCGVLGIVVGLLAILVGAHLGTGATRLLVSLTVAGALIAPFIVVRSARPLDRWVVVRAGMFGGGLVVLALVVAVLSLVIHRFASGSTPGSAFLVLGLINAGALIWMGVFGARSIRRVAVIDDESGRFVASRAILRIASLEAIAYAASLVAIVLIIRR
jgi:hypothetical protein